MLRVNYKILPKRQRREKSIGARSVHNSFYTAESHHEPNLSEYHGDYADDYFGLRFFDESNEKDSQMQQRPLLD